MWKSCRDGIDWHVDSLENDRECDFSRSAVMCNYIRSTADFVFLGTRPAWVMSLLWYPCSSTGPLWRDPYIGTNFEGGTQRFPWGRCIIIARKAHSYREFYRVLSFGNFENVDFGAFETPFKLLFVRTCARNFKAIFWFMYYVFS